MKSRIVAKIIVVVAILGYALMNIARICLPYLQTYPYVGRTRSAGTVTLAGNNTNKGLTGKSQSEGTGGGTSVPGNSSLSPTLLIASTGVPSSGPSDSFHPTISISSVPTLSMTLTGVPTSSPTITVQPSTGVKPSNNATEVVHGFGTGPWPRHPFVTFVEFQEMMSLQNFYMDLFKAQQSNSTLEYVAGNPLRLLAIGGSVTGGNGPTKMNWVELTEKRSLEQWAHHGTFIEATNGGIGAVDFNIFPSCLARLGAYKADVIVVELSLNAHANGPLDDLFRVLTTLPNEPRRPLINRRKTRICMD